MSKFDEPFGSSIFCDDIRSEVGNKASYIGVYNAVIYVPAFPMVVPKFGIATTFNEPRKMAENRDWSITIKIFLPGNAPDKPNVGGEIPANKATVDETFKTTTLPPDPDLPELFTINTLFVMSPMILIQAGRIKVRADYGDKIIRLGTLRVEPQSAGAANPLFPFPGLGAGTALVIPTLPLPNLPDNPLLPKRS